MKTSNLIYQISQLVNVNPDAIWQISATSCAILIALSLFVLSNPAHYWYLPLLGIMVFTVLNTGVSRGKTGLLKRRQNGKNANTEQLDYIAPVMITRFGKQNPANKQFIRMAA